MIDTEIAHYTYGAVAAVHVVALLIIWLWPLKGGDKISGLYWWSWFTTFLSVMISWGPVTLTYPLSFLDMQWGDFLYMGTSLASVDGPMFTYAIPLIFFVFAWINSPDEGLVVLNNRRFWISWVAGLLYAGASIFY